MDFNKPITSYQRALALSRSLTLHLRCPTSDETYLSGSTDPFYYVMATETSHSSGDIRSFHEFILTFPEDGHPVVTPHLSTRQEEMFIPELGDTELIDKPVPRTNPIKREDGKRIRPKSLMREAAVEKAMSEIEKHADQLQIMAYTLEAGEHIDFSPYTRRQFGSAPRTSGRSAPHSHNDHIKQLQGQPATSISESIDATAFIDEHSKAEYIEPAEPQQPEQDASPSDKPVILSFESDRKAKTPLAMQLEAYKEAQTGNKPPKKQVREAEIIRPPARLPEEEPLHHLTRYSATEAASHWDGPDVQEPSLPNPNREKWLKRLPPEKPGTPFADALRNAQADEDQPEKCSPAARR